MAVAFSAAVLVWDVANDVSGAVHWRWVTRVAWSKLFCDGDSVAIVSVTVYVVWAMCCVHNDDDTTRQWSMAVCKYWLLRFVWLWVRGWCVLLVGDMSWWAVCWRWVTHMLWLGRCCCDDGL